MASIFKPPKITQEQLSSTLLEYGEIVYNTTKNEFFTGNGTSGGITLFNEKPTTTSELTNDSNFVTSSDVEESLSAYQPISGMNIYALKSDIPSGGSGTGDSYTFPLEQRTFICMSESVSEDGSIEMQQIDSEYNRTSGNRYINNVIVIPSGAPSGKVDFVYEEISGFVYNPFTTIKFQLDCIPTKEMPTLQEIYFIVEKAGEETVIATTEGLDEYKIQRYNAQNDNSIFCSQVIELKNILAKEFASSAGDKVKLRFLFGYQYFGTSNQKNAPSDQKNQFTVSVSSADKTSGRYCFFLSINKDFSNPDLPSNPSKYNCNNYGVNLKENIFTDDGNTRYPIDKNQNINLALMLNDTGIFGRYQGNYTEDFYYNFNSTIDYASDYSLYDDYYLTNCLYYGGRVRGYTLNNNLNIHPHNNSGSLRFVMFNPNYIDFQNIPNKFALGSVFFVKHKIYIYNPNGYTLEYYNNNDNYILIASDETGITEFNFYIDYDSTGVYGYNDYFYVLEKVSSEGQILKTHYMKNWN